MKKSGYVDELVREHMAEPGSILFCSARRSAYLLRRYGVRAFPVRDVGGVSFGEAISWMWDFGYDEGRLLSKDEAVEFARELSEKTKGAIETIEGARKELLALRMIARELSGITPGDPARP